MKKVIRSLVGNLASSLVEAQNDVIRLVNNRVIKSEFLEANCQCAEQVSVPMWMEWGQGIPYFQALHNVVQDRTVFDNQHRALKADLTKVSKKMTSAAEKLVAMADYLESEIEKM